MTFAWSVFSCIWTEHEDLLLILPYAVRTQKIKTRKNPVFAHFSRSGIYRKYALVCYNHHDECYILSFLDTYLEPSQTSNYWMPLAIFAKIAILDARQGSEYVSIWIFYKYIRMLLLTWMTVQLLFFKILLYIKFLIVSDNVLSLSFDEFTEINFGG